MEASPNATSGSKNRSTINSVQDSAESRLAAAKRHSTLPPAPLDTTVKHVFPILNATRKTQHYPPIVYTLWILLLATITLAATTAPSVVIFLVDIGSPFWLQIVFACLSGFIVLLIAPTWGILLLYRPPRPVPEESIENALNHSDPVDIVVTTYTEDLDEIAGTVAAIQNIEWDGPVNVYVLDDARRADVAALCADTLYRGARFPVTRVTRPTNEGKKGGNLNNFLYNLTRTADFFVTLDCDMRPFPNLLKMLFGELYSLPENDRRRVAFVQSPQFFRNYDIKRDPFDVLTMHFIKTVLPAMDRVSTVPYIGTSALWRREALERAGGFITDHATEDVVTGCQVHQTTNEHGERYISRYCALPVAAGLSPRTLAELCDQRTRWNIGLVQMAAHHRWFLFCRGLSFTQRFVYFATCGGWMRNLLLFFSVLAGTIFVNASTAYLAVYKDAVTPPPAWYAAMCTSIVIPSLSWLLLPGTSPRARLSGVQTGFVYASTELVAVLYTLGLKVPIRHASESGSARYHPHFLFHGIAYCLVFVSAILAIVLQAQSDSVSVAPIIQILLLLFMWSVVYFPILLALFGYKAREDAKWLALEDGRVDLFQDTVWSEEDNLTFHQLKWVVRHLSQRVEDQARVIQQLSDQYGSDASPESQV